MIIFVRPAIAIGLFVLAYSGYTDIFQVDELKRFDIDSINHELSVQNRFIQVDKGFVTNQYAVEMNSFNKSLPLYLYYPLISAKDYQIFLATKVTDELMHTKTKVEIPVPVLIRRDATEMNRSCLQDKSCLEELYQQQSDSGISVKGLTITGEYAVVPSVRNELKEMGYILPEKVVVLEENYEPSTSWTAWLKLIGGVIGLLLIVGSYFPGKRG
jgi:hypothetical protein